MIYYAHSGTGGGKSDWQTLKAHSLAVAELAAKMAEPLGLAKAAFAAGLLHDLGKYTVAFQKRLEGADIRVDHSTAGARHVLETTKGSDRIVAELLAYCILGHHAGLPDMRGTESAFATRLERPAGEKIDPAWQADLVFDIEGLAPAFDWQETKDNSEEKKTRLAFQVAFLGRMLFSCLVDADFKDTEAFYTALEGRLPDREWPLLQAVLPQFLAAFAAHMAGRINSDGDLNRLRSDILAHVRGKAAEKPGLFTLTVPTGGGKTLASLAFALEHAKLHGHSRIIYAIPFTSIIDQTADIFRGILGQEHVLEHHSAIDEEKLDPKTRKESRDRLKLAMEDWSAPVVITTNVQFFESLFAARTSRSRKLHNIAGSVIILDEAQTIPRHLIAPAVRALDELARNYKCTVVLCTATQPALDQRNFPQAHPAGLALEGRELAPNPACLAEKLKRVTLRRAGDMSNDDLVAALAETPQGLVIVNSRRHALELYKQAKTAGLDGLVHLTTRQYAAHRRQILAEVRDRLKEGTPCRVIATSLIEAGVDVDFPCAWRAEAGLDQITQAAGRVNREGKRPLEDSIVTIFSAPDYPPPSEIKGLIGDMGRMQDKHADLLSPAAIEAYFAEVYWRTSLDSKNILGRFRMDRTQFPAGRIGTDFAYRGVAEDFRMIESQMVPVIIARDQVAKDAVDELGIENIPSGRIARALQVYVVQVPAKDRALMLANGHVKFIRPDLRGDQFAVLQTASMYGDETGLLWETADYLGAENSIL